MPTYKLSCNVTVSAYTSVTAESLEAAIEESHHRDIVLDPNGYGTGTDESESWMVEHADGAPQNIEGEEA